MDKLPAKIIPKGPLVGFEQENPPDALGTDVRQALINLRKKHPQWDGVVLFCGSQVSHWIQISANEVISCQSFLTPRLIAVLNGADHPHMDVLSDVISRPERVATKLHQADITMNSGMVTGALIGAELAAAKPYWLGQDVVVINGAAYVSALRSQGLSVTAYSSEELSI